MAERLRDTKDNMRKYNLSQISKRKGKDDGKDTKFEELLFSVMPSNYLILCCPFLLLPSIFPSIGVFSNESALHIRWPKYWSFSFRPSNEYSGLISFRIDWFDLLAVQGTFKVFSSTTVWRRQFFGTQPSLWSNSHICSGKTIALTIWTFVGKVMSLLFNTLSRFVKAIFPKNKCFLISWLQSPSTLILEPKKMKSDSFHIFTTYLPQSDVTICHDLRLYDCEF